MARLEAAAIGQPAQGGTMTGGTVSSGLERLPHHEREILTPIRFGKHERPGIRLT